MSTVAIIAIAGFLLLGLAFLFRTSSRTHRSGDAHADTYHGYIFHDGSGSDSGCDSGSGSSDGGGCSDGGSGG